MPIDKDYRVYNIELYYVMLIAGNVITVNFLCGHKMALVPFFDKLAIIIFIFRQTIRRKT